jgi:choline kinase
MIKPTLLILAAGMGSRYGGLKQIDAIGPSGETIIDYSVFDAIRAGFGKVVFVIRKNIEKEFREVFDNRFAGKIEVDYAFQELDILPDGFILPKDRQKPWGTCHAVLMAKNIINEPFAVINADDFYGADSYKKIADFLMNTSNDEKTYGMVGFQLNKTMSEHGYVSRGVCELDENSYLRSVVEREKIGFVNGKVTFIKDNKHYELTGNETVSMNFWGFKPDFFERAENEFISFLNEHLNTPKSEFYIPLVVNNLIYLNTYKLKVLKTSSSWFGVTYMEDKPLVISSILELIGKGIYPEKLWEY